MIKGGLTLTHGHARHGKISREYRAWRGAIARCYRASDKDYSDYGRRGISMSEEWHKNFSQFYQDMGPCPKGGTLERKDYDGNYCKENCCWAPISTQANNKRDNVHINCSDGIRRTLAQLARLLGWEYWIVRDRVDRTAIFQIPQPPPRSQTPHL
jgi:hypothetical protein